MLEAQGALASAVVALEGRSGELVDAIVDRIRNEIAELDGRQHPELAEVVRRSCAANLTVGLEALRSDRLPPLNLPTAALDEARMAAQAGIALDPLMRTYRIGHEMVFDALIAQLERTEVDAGVRSEALRAAARYTFAFVDAVAPQISREFTQARDELVRSSSQRRMQLVRELLDGGSVDTAQLGYEVRATHVGLVVDGADPERWVRDAARDAPTLIVSVHERLVWAWMGADDEHAETVAARCSEAHDELRVGTGEPAPGLAGMRQTHRQAQAAARVAARKGLEAARYGDVALEAMALADERSAREFVQHELGPLDGDDARTVKLRLTLDAYLSTALNASSAAALLGVNDRTVAYRIRMVEELLGQPVATSATELAAALRWLALLRRDAATEGNR